MATVTVMVMVMVWHGDVGGWEPSHERYRPSRQTCVGSRGRRRATIRPFVSASYATTPLEKCSGVILARWGNGSSYTGHIRSRSGSGTRRAIRTFTALRCAALRCTAESSISNFMTRHRIQRIGIVDGPLNESVFGAVL